MQPSRHYENRPPGGGNFAGSIVGRLILANVIVFILENLLPDQFVVFFALTPRTVVENFYLWQIVTYMFLHAGFTHLFFNMLMLWLFGRTLEMVWGGKRFLNYYIACGIGGAAFSFVFNFNHPVLGASGAIFGLYLAYAMIFPNNQIYLNFLFPVKAKHLIIFLAVLQLTMGFSGPDRIAYFAHLGGMATGLLFFQKQIAASGFFSRINRGWKSYSTKSKKNGVAQDDVKIDSILDKICAKGYDNLSATEKRILDHYSKQRNEDSDES
ncbi:MAG: rhomboid family intramembrane serine protease [Candidatus Latescibacterota bacterium]